MPPLTNYVNIDIIYVYLAITTQYHKRKGESREMFRISTEKLTLAKLNAGVDSSKQLAELAGVSVNTLSRLNNGGSAKLHTLRRLATALNIDPAELLEET